MEDDAIRELVTRLARPHSSGGDVIGRAAILAEGADFDQVMAWITSHSGTPETTILASRSGLHGGRLDDRGGATPPAPSRFVLPPGVLG